eukprot:CAMPEP_0174371374 /NCGR_PEP_ID=MMETSP0811_2-20130205/99499_1 /TAXON_ID=73025 ORGANISM="Eutreptiella gymnastica-like, Strain CCMP1594" /NCGR_SAMPLE_ID=MMETSP0811_2 /ASSEMBLY_ACC=CAM_ASM_000667 /LENGTH=205 /DNA_ID=CAMNT_0015517681 /DNA_START=45 /DNA_END=659 /DNA_ORIENTATION=+
MGTYPIGTLVFGIFVGVSAAFLTRSPVNRPMLYATTGHVATRPVSLPRAFPTQVNQHPVLKAAVVRASPQVSSLEKLAAAGTDQPHVSDVVLQPTDMFLLLLALVTAALGGAVFGRLLPTRCTIHTPPPPSIAMLSTTGARSPARRSVAQYATAQGSGDAQPRPLVLDRFCFRQFDDPDYRGTRVKGMSKDEFVAVVNRLYAKQV